MNEPKRLYRSRTDRQIAGVCGGLGEYFNIDPTLIRIVFLIMGLFGGNGIILYIVLAIVIPEADRYRDDYDQSRYVEVEKRKNDDPFEV
jgi:phage shock protein PspC (stress-responsive transcriptional regulator)